MRMPSRCLIILLALLTLILACFGTERKKILDRGDFSVWSDYYQRRFGADYLTIDFYRHRSFWFDEHRTLLLARNYQRAEAYQLGDSILDLRLGYSDRVSLTQFITNLRAKSPKLEILEYDSEYEAARLEADSTPCCIFGLFQRVTPHEAYLLRVAVGQAANFDIHIMPAEQVKVRRTSDTMLELTIRWTGGLGEDTLYARLIDGPSDVDVKLATRE